MARRVLEKRKSQETEESPALVKSASCGPPRSGPIRAQSILSKIRLLWVARNSRLYRRLCFNVQREVCDFLVEHIMPRIWGNTLVRHNMHNRDRTTATLSVQFETTAVFCSLDEDTVLCVGGQKRISEKSYLLRIASAHLEEQQNLTRARGAPGIVKYRRFVYVFGGWDEKSHSLSASEKYSIKEQTWTALRDMLHPRCYFSPCVAGEDIYLPRAGQVLEVMNTVSEEFKTLSIWLTDLSESRSVSFVSNGELIIITGKYQIAKWRINAEPSVRVSDIQMYDSNSSRSNIPPVHRGTAVLWVRGHDGALVKFNLDNHTLQDK